MAVRTGVTGLDFLHRRRRPSTRRRRRHQKRGQPRHSHSRAARPLQYPHGETNTVAKARQKRRGRSLPAQKTAQPSTLIGDLAELARVLASLSPEERSALLALAQGLRTPAT